MTEREQRRALRLGTTQVLKMELHSTDNHALHFGMSCRESWELLEKISKESWYIETGEKAPERLDKSIVRILHKEDHVSYS